MFGYCHEWHDSDTWEFQIVLHQGKLMIDKKKIKSET